MRKPQRILAEGLGHPEGPDVLANGEVVFVETYAGKIRAWSEKGGLRDFADCGGAPNSCMWGSDGCLYIAQYGGAIGGWVPPRPAPPSIQRVTPSGKVEVVATEVDGVKLNAPNDLTWGKDGRLYFTDSGIALPLDEDHPPDPGYVFALNPDGTGEVVRETGRVYPNGITTEADGSIVWVESFTRKVYRYRTDGTVQEVFTVERGHTPDGLKVAENGDLWITAVAAGGVDIVAPDGRYVDFLETGGVPLNCVFDGDTLLITDYGTADTSGSSQVGRLIRVDVGVRGLPLQRGRIS
jgi:gluconolactonase